MRESPLCVAAVDSQLRYVAISRRWSQCVGNLGAALGEVVTAPAEAGGPERWQAACEATLRGQAHPGGVDVWVRADGVRQCLRWWTTPVVEPGGRVVGVVLSGEDAVEAAPQSLRLSLGPLLARRSALKLRRVDGVRRDVDATGRPRRQARSREGERAQPWSTTAETQATAALRESEARSAGIINAALEAVISCDASQRIVLVNPAAVQLFGHAESALIGQPLDVLLPAEHRAAHQHHIRTFSGAGVSGRRMGGFRPVTGLSADGRVMPLEGSISRGEVGGQQVFTAMLRPLASHAEAAEAIRHGQERFQQLAEAIREVFWLTDVAKTEAIYVSPAYETIFGRPVSELITSPGAWMDAIHPDDRERVRASALRQAEGTYDEQYRVVRPDGSHRWVHDRAFPVRDAHGAVVRVAGVAEDVTERRELEEMLRQTQKMESIGQLAGGVAHDFNNLLTVIVASAELLRSELPDSAQHLPVLDDILDAGRRGAALTRQLLAFSRQEVIEPRVVDFGAVIADAEKLLRRLIGEDIELVTRLDSAGAPVRVDPGQWSQVLFNLAVNARDAMPGGGRLLVETRSLMLPREAAERRGLAAGHYAELSVADTGSGMSPELLRRVFEPFFTTKPRGKGTGLGLAVVYGVVQQAGGRVEVESTPDVGTTFTILVPAVAHALPPASAAAPACSRDGDEVVLVVEDEAAVRRVTTRMLARGGYKVLTASDGNEALRLLDAHEGPLHLLLTDVVMPGLDGPSLAAEVRKRYPNTRVLFASGYIDDALSRRGVSGSGITFLQKPYTPTLLLQRIRQLLDSA